MGLLTSPRFLGVLAILAGLAWTHYRVYGAGQDSIRAEWQAQVDEIKEAAIADALANAETTVEVVTKYVDRTKEINWDDAVVRSRVKQLCDESLRERTDVPGAASSIDQQAGARATRDAFASEVPECVDIANRLQAILEYDAREKARAGLSERVGK